MREKIIEMISEAGVGFVEKANTIRTTCPSCGRADKFSILKKNGSCICYHAKCDFGKRWLPDWVSMTLNISIKEALGRVYSSEINPDKLRDERSYKLEFSEDAAGEALMPIPYPEFHMVTMDDPAAAEGIRYLEGRGVTKEQMLKYNICFSPLQRRVYFPIQRDGETYGYQGRHIDKVDDKFKVRNNEGFRRELLVMFADNLDGSDFAIMAEGPVDGLKFEKVGGFIATMGKIVSDAQLEILYSYGIKTLYLALDDDAAVEMNEIVAKTHLKTLRLMVPESCVARCKQDNKKADFGECTFDEAEQAFHAARPFTTALHWGGA